MSKKFKINNIAKFVFFILLVLALEPLIYGGDFTNVIKEGYNQDVDINYELHKNLNVNLSVDSFEFENLEIGVSEDGITNLVYDVPIKINVKIKRGNTVIVKEYITKVSMNDIYLDINENPAELESENKAQEINDQVLGSGSDKASSSSSGASGSSSVGGVKTGVVSFSKPTSLAYKNIIDKEDITNKKYSKGSEGNSIVLKDDVSELEDSLINNMNKNNDNYQGILAKNSNFDEDSYDLIDSNDGFWWLELCCFIVGLFALIVIFLKRMFLIELFSFRRKKRVIVNNSRNNQFIDYEDIF